MRKRERERERDLVTFTSIGKLPGVALGRLESGKDFQAEARFPIG
jgi:hypothetical protein